MRAEKIVVVLFLSSCREKFSFSKFYSNLGRKKKQKTINFFGLVGEKTVTRSLLSEHQNEKIFVSFR